MKKIAFILLAVFVGLLLSSQVGRAAEVEVYLQFGGVNLNEDGISEGHKFFVGAGANVGTPFKKGLQGFLLLNGWKLGEALDEDTEMPLQGFRVGGEGRYNVIKDDFLVYPFVGAGINYMERKYAKNQDEWTSNTFADFQAGFGAKYKWFFVKAAAKVPVVLDTNGKTLDPDVGFIAGGGLEVKRFFAGYFYEITAFDNNKRGQTAVKFSYVMFGYRF